VVFLNLQEKAGIVPQLRQDVFLPNIFNSLFIYNFIIRRYIIQQLTDVRTAYTKKQQEDLFFNPCGDCNYLSSMAFIS
jgi:hypothetical protein